MLYGKFRFASFKDFVTVQNLAIKDGYKTVEEFEIFLKINYSNLIINKL